MLVIKKDLFKGLKQPISQRLFGTNKTWRGFVFVAFVNAFLVYLLELAFNFQLQQAFFIGCILGCSYMLFELPNSFMKRKLGIQPGQEANSHKIMFKLIDKMDSAFGVSLVYFLIGNISFQSAVLLFICSSVTHISISQILVQLHLKKSF
ncbi:CDP-archaeol synthase [Kordia sp.]|uniref:CDP-archaeol synthase n=1 Tax=Kordia sp. TaxID=1965332 RepID=UPI003B5A70EC